MRVLFVSAVLWLAACADGPTVDECQQLRDHLIELQVKESGGKPVTESERAQMDAFAKRVKYTETCTDRTAQKLVRCALAATTTEEARACDEKKKAKSEPGSGS